MKLLLVRHGESTGNRDHIWAGITDNELTNHGFQQATRLAAYLQKQYIPMEEEVYVIGGIFCSDLIRARRTATAIATALNQEATVTSLLREQDLGWREGRSLKDGDKTAAENQAALIAKPGESKNDMDNRAQTFIHDFLRTHFAQHTRLRSEAVSKKHAERVIIVVSHGLFLLRLYYQLVNHLSISLPPSPSWSNTGCTTIRLREDGVALVSDVNSVQHLQGLKRTRAGGSSQYDTKQQKMSDFFGNKRSKLSIKSSEALQPVSPIRWETDATAQVHSKTEAEELDELDIAAQIKAIDAACGG